MDANFTGINHSGAGFIQVFADFGDLSNPDCDITFGSGALGRQSSALHQGIQDACSLKTCSVGEPIE